MWAPVTTSQDSFIEKNERNIGNSRKYHYVKRRKIILEMQIRKLKSSKKIKKIDTSKSEII